MKVMLWKPGVYDSTRGELPTIGLAILATSAIEAGHEAFIVDHHFSPPPEDEIETAAVDILETEAPDLLCISAVSHEWRMSRVQAVLDRAHEMDIPVWVGGPHALAFWDILEKDERVTKVVTGEADGRFNQILESTEKVVELGRCEDFRPPAFPVMRNAEELITYPLFVSRGCHYNCTFCAATQVFGRRWRARGLSDEFWKELDDIAVNHPKCELISVIDDAFTQDLDHAKEFLREYLRRGYPYKVSVFNVRADYLDEEFLVLLKKTGVEHLAVGIESGDPEVFRMLRKGEKLEQIDTAIKMMQKVGIIPWLNMIVGLPGDTPEAHRRSVDWVLSHDKPRVVQWNIFTPFRGTPAYDFFVKRGDIEDGYIPEFQGRYQMLPEDGMFDAVDFTKEEKTLAQLEGYLRCNTPILILSDKKVRELCKKHDMWDLYENWRRNAPIAEFLENTVPKKIAKGQEVLDMDEYNSILAEFKNDNEYPTDPFVYKGAVP
jgi:anaerobic magnesium-protoporphyrin IX monomethyl ester cyclase